MYNITTEYSVQRMLHLLLLDPLLQGIIPPFIFFSLRDLQGLF